MNNETRVAVCSRSFSKNSMLRDELLSRYKSVTFNDSGSALAGEQLVKFLLNHDKAIVALERIDDAILSRLPQLQVIGKYGVGLDMIDLEAMRRHGKRLGWTGGVNRRSVAELVVALAVMMLRGLPEANREVLSGTWRHTVGRQLSDRTVGIIGCGHVGQEVIRLLRPFGCRVLAHDILDISGFCNDAGAESVGLQTLLKRADVISLHIPLDDSTSNILSAERLKIIEPGSILINTARGGLVDETALKLALQNGEIAAAAFDVFSDEPPTDEELLRLPNFFATPHLGGSAAEAILAMGRAAIAGLDNNQIP